MFKKSMILLVSIMLGLMFIGCGEAIEDYEMQDVRLSLVSGEKSSAARSLSLEDLSDLNSTITNVTRIVITDGDVNYYDSNVTNLNDINASLPIGVELFVFEKDSYDRDIYSSTFQVQSDTYLYQIVMKMIDLFRYEVTFHGVVGDSATINGSTNTVVDSNVTFIVYLDPFVENNVTLYVNSEDYLYLIDVSVNEMFVSVDFSDYETARYVTEYDYSAKVISEGITGELTLDEQVVQFSIYFPAGTYDIILSPTEDNPLRDPVIYINSEYHDDSSETYYPIVRNYIHEGGYIEFIIQPFSFDVGDSSSFQVGGFNLNINESEVVE